MDVGQRFSRLCVVRDMGRHPKGRSILCRCDCGTEKVVDLGNLLSLNTRSCGCFRDEEVARRSMRNTEDVCANKVYFSCVRRCKKNSWDLDLTKEDVKALVFSSHCYYCDRDRESAGIKWVRKDQILQREVIRLGIDRLDSNVGYLKSNCVPCCFDCNSIKLDRDMELLKTVLPNMLRRVQSLTGLAAPVPESVTAIDEHY